VIWFLSGLLLLLSLPLATVALLVWLHYYLRWNYLHHVVRIFQEKPLFVIPRGKPVEGAEDVRFPTSHGLTLRGCYLKARGERRGVILFGLEFGSNRWSCVPYCEHLLDRGYDVFAFEPRGQGDSDRHPGYDPLQWLTDFEVADVHAALAYLKSRPDADPKGVGFFGISKGGSAGLLAGAADSWIRCFVTDGAFATYATMVPYMRKWYGIYNNQYILQGLLPLWYYGLIGQVGLNEIARERGCRFPHLESVVRRLSPRPLLMIHGGGDTYIKPEMGQALFDRARRPKEFWVVPGAKHNQALHIAAEEYRRRVLEFFDRHLAESTAAAPVPAVPAIAAQPV
jgi:fermentation-respiration switch protein FrsA (DUF1100 family)